MEQNSSANTTKGSGSEAIFKILETTKSEWAITYWTMVLIQLAEYGSISDSMLNHIDEITDQEQLSGGKIISHFKW